MALTLRHFVDSLPSEEAAGRLGTGPAPASSVLESRSMSAVRSFYFAYFWFPDSGGREALA